MKKLANLLRWPWTPWADILTFSYDGGYLLQGRTNRITGRTQFAVRKMGQWWRLQSQAPMATEEQLQKAGLWHQ
jgi:hypothetical protein